MKINCDYTNDKQRRKEELAGFYYPTDLVIRYVWFPDRVEYRQFYIGPSKLSVIIFLRHYLDWKILW